jgi:glutamine cyclotransferase
MKNFYFYFLILLTASGIISCNNKGESNKNGNIKDTNFVSDAPKTLLSMTLSDPKGKNYVIGEKISIQVQNPQKIVCDSALLFINSKEKIKLGVDLKYEWNTTLAKCGTNTLSVDYYTAAGKENVQKNVVLLSDVKPKTYTFKIKNTYKHDKQAYTQGLFWHNGFMYEATGLEGESTVRKVKLETGDVIQSFAIPRDVFGEGITLSDDKIVQISWQGGRGFVYDANTFQHLEEFSYSGEGWGITTDGKKLYMTNGTNQVHVLENKSYTIIEELEVCDNEGPVKYLNELEFIEGEIYSNIYRYDKIVRIDPKTGKVLAYVDLSHILPFEDYKAETDVLNGIAYDAAKKRLFVTGKLWPKLFEIELVEKR